MVHCKDDVLLITHSRYFSLANKTSYNENTGHEELNTIKSQRWINVGRHMASCDLVLIRIRHRFDITFAEQCAISIITDVKYHRFLGGVAIGGYFVLVVITFNETCFTFISLTLESRCLANVALMWHVTLRFVFKKKKKGKKSRRQLRGKLWESKSIHCFFYSSLAQYKITLSFFK